jgi:hypothetical protein
MTTTRDSLPINPDKVRALLAMPNVTPGVAPSVTPNVAATEPVSIPLGRVRGDRVQRLLQMGKQAQEAQEPGYLKQLAGAAGRGTLSVLQMPLAVRSAMGDANAVPPLAYLEGLKQQTWTGSAADAFNKTAETFENEGLLSRLYSNVGNAVYNPGAAFVTMAESAPQMVPQSVAMLGGAAIGTLAAPGAGTAIGGAAGLGLMSAVQDFTSEYLEAFKQAGVDTSDVAALYGATQDPEIRRKAVKHAAAHGITVGLFDGLTAGLSSKLKPLVATATEGMSRVSKAAMPAAADMILQGTGGSVGELNAQGAQIAVGTREKIDAGAVVQEFMAEVVQGIGENAATAAAPGSRRTAITVANAEAWARLNPEKAAELVAAGPTRDAWAAAGLERIPEKDRAEIHKVLADLIWGTELGETPGTTTTPGSGLPPSDGTQGPPIQPGAAAPPSQPTPPPAPPPTPPPSAPPDSEPPVVPSPPAAPPPSPPPSPPATPEPPAMPSIKERAQEILDAGEADSIEDAMEQARIERAAATRNPNATAAGTTPAVSPAVAGPPDPAAEAEAQAQTQDDLARDTAAVIMRASELLREGKAQSLPEAIEMVRMERAAAAAPEPAADPAAPAPAPAPAPPIAKAKPRSGYFTKEDLERRILEQSGVGNVGDSMAFAAGERTGLDVGGGSRMAEDTEYEMGADAFKTMQDYLAADARGRSKLSAAYGKVIDKAKRSMRLSPDPQQRFLAALHDNMSRGKQKPKIEAKPGDLPVGTTFKINGENFQVLPHEDGYLVLKDGEGFPITPVDALDSIPVDKGSMQGHDGSPLPTVTGSLDAAPTTTVDDIPMSDGPARTSKNVSAPTDNVVRKDPPRKQPAETKPRVGPERTRVLREMREVFGDAGIKIVPVIDAFALGWARAQGKSPDEFYKTLRVVKGGKPGKGSLFMTAHHGTPHNFKAESLVEIDGKRQYVPMGQEPEGATVVAQFPMGRFDINKIGSGEGAQVYGYGLYFAENRDVAQYYKNAGGAGRYKIRFSDGREFSAKNTVARTGNSVEDYAAAEITESLYGGMGARGTLIGPKRWLNELADNVESRINRLWDTAERQQFLREVAARLRQMATQEATISRGGRIYLVDLKPSEDEYLLWDRPLNKQSEKVKSALLASKYADDEWSDLTGKSIYEDVERKVASNPLERLANPSEEASRVLKELGVRGVKYLDGASRDAGSGSYNYVIFDDADVSILNVEQRAKDEAIGSYELKASGDRIIRALKGANRSTVVHEVAHDFLMMLPQMDAALAQRAYDSLGAKSAADLTEAQHEQFARGFESYMRTGKSPIDALADAFKAFKTWLLDIYRSIKGTPLEGQINKELKAVFDEMLSRGGMTYTPDMVSVPGVESVQIAETAPPPADALTPTRKQPSLPPTQRDLMGNPIAEPATGTQNEMVFGTEGATASTAPAREGKDAKIAAKFNEKATDGLGFDENSGAIPETPDDGIPFRTAESGVQLSTGQPGAPANPTQVWNANNPPAPPLPANPSDDSWRGRTPPVSSSSTKRPRVLSPHWLVKWLSVKFAVPIRYGDMGKGMKAAIGWYRARDQIIRVRGTAWANLWVAGHEAAHHIDNINDITQSLSSQALAELATLDYDAKLVATGQGRPTEGFAEYMARYWLGEGPDLAAHAPAFTAEFFGPFLGDAKRKELKANVEAFRDHVAAYYGQTAFDRVRASISPDGRGTHNAPGAEIDQKGVIAAATSKAKRWFRAFMLNWVDAGYDIVALDWHLKNTNASADIPLELIYRNANRSAAGAGMDAFMKGVYFMSHGQSVRMAPGFEHVMSLLSDKKKYDDMRDFWMARHQLWLHENGIKQPFRVDDLKAVVDEFGKDDSIVAAADALVAMNNALTDALVDAKVISRKTADNVKSRWYHYAPSIKVQEDDFADSPWSGLRSIGKQPLRRIKGSGAQIVDPIAATAWRFVSTYQLLHRADMTNSLIDALKRAPAEVQNQYLEAGFDEKTRITTFSLKEIENSLIQMGFDDKQVKAIAKDPDIDTLMAVYRPDYLARLSEPGMVMRYEGKNPAYYRLNSNLTAAVTSLTPYSPELLVTFLGQFTRLQRFGAIMTNLGFTLTNPIRDYATYLWQGPGNLMSRVYQPPMEVVRLLASKAGKLAGVEVKDEVRELFESMHASPHVGAVGYRPDALRIKEVLGGVGTSKIPNVPKWMLRKIVSLNEAVESIPRLAAFRHVLAADGITTKDMRAGIMPKKATLLAASQAASDSTVDFSRMGRQRWLGQTLLFANAIIQSNARFIRNFTSKEALLHAAPAMALQMAATLLYWVDVKDEDWWKNADKKLKYFFYVFADKDGREFMRLPMSYETGVYFSGTTLAILDGLENADPSIPWRFITNTFLRNVPKPSFAMPLADAYANWDSFRAKPIVPRGQEDDPAYTQYGPRTTALPKALGSLTNTSPAKIEYVVDGYTGGLYGRLFRPVEKGLTGGKFEARDIPLLSNVTFSQHWDGSQELFVELLRQAKEHARRAEDEGRMVGIEHERLHELQRYDALINSVRRELKDVQGRDERESFEKWLIGLRRRALGFEDLPRFPDPIRNRPDHPVVKKAVRHLIGVEVDAATNPMPERKKGELQANYTARVKEWNLRRQQAETLLEDLGWTPEEVRGLMSERQKAKGLSSRIVDENGNLTAHGKRMRQIPGLLAK